MYKTIKNNLLAFKFICTNAPRRAVFDLVKAVYLPVYFFLEHTYVYKFVLDSIQYNRPFRYVVYYIAGLFAGQLILSRVWNFYDIYFREKDEMKIIKKLQLEVYERAVRLDLIKYDDKQFYDDYVWNINDAKTRFIETYGNVVNFFDSTVNLIIYGTFIVTSDFLGLILIIAVFFTNFFINKKINKINYTRDMDLRRPRRLRDYVKRVYYMQDYANELRMNNITGKFHEKNKQAKDEAVSITKKTGKPLTALNAANSLIHLFILETAYILYLAYRALVLKVISYGTIISIIRSLWNFSNNMYGFTGALAQLNRHSLYIEKYKEFLAFKSEIKSGDYSLDNEKIEKIELKNISFAYEPGAPVLKNINMTINKGEKVAIVGYNGAGKTTLSNIILRLYEQNSGEILINGKPVEDIEPRSYKRKFSAVFQDFYLYAASLRENIALDINSDEEKTAMAAELSGFKEKLDSFENGLDTNLTKEFEEDGVNLSGGETQKLAIARAVYRESEIIIMDEPSSALDPIAEFNLNQTITQIAKERIVFFISHRLSTTKIADKIFYIENGEITESGTHDELMELNGKYAEMFNIQAEKYNV